MFDRKRLLLRLSLLERFWLSSNGAAVLADPVAVVVDTVCIYVAERAERSGFPPTTVTEVSKVIDPTTAND